MLLRRDRRIAIAALAMLALIAWGYTLWLAELMQMPGMETPDLRMSASPIAPVMIPHPQPWGAVEVLLLFAMWTIMMAGMMTPSAAPMVLLYAQIRRRAVAGGYRMAGAGWLFAGYLTAWTLFSLAATLAQWALERAALLSASMELTSRPLAAAVLLVAGGYQFTPMKKACLSQCQSPFGVIQRNGGFGSTTSSLFALGLRHGAFCVGCCWGLMLVLFAVGIMNAVWLAAIAGFVLLEKLLPAARWPSRTAGVALLAGAIGMAVG